MTRHLAIRIIFCFILATSLLSISFPLHVERTQAQAQGASRKMNNFEVSGRFLEEWSKQGSDERSIYVNGLPITARRPEISMEDGKSYETQWFERARYELHPSNKKPHDVLLGRLGSNAVEGRGHIDSFTGKLANPADQPFVGIDKPPEADGKLKVWFPETRHSITGTMLDYWNRYGGLQQFGYPISEPFHEVSATDGKSYYVQYFERNRMELHPGKASPYEVQLGLLGVEQYKMQAVAADQLPVAVGSNVKSTKDTIVIGTIAEPKYLTFRENTDAALRIRSLIEDGFVGEDDNGNLFPLLAWYVPTLENGGARFVGVGDDRHLEVKYKLRHGIKWSDGKDVSSNDAVFAKRVMYHANRYEYERLESIENPDRLTVIYRYRSVNQTIRAYQSLECHRADCYFPLFFKQKLPLTSHNYARIGSVLPEHLLAEKPGSTYYEPKPTPFDRQPVGTGPWRVESWAAGQEMVLVPNEHYSLTPKPTIKRIEIKFMPDAQAVNNAFKAGTIDLVLSDVNRVPPSDVVAIKSAGGQVAAIPSPTWEHLDFFFEYEPFKDRRVREAHILAINRVSIKEAVFGGTAPVLNSIVAPSITYSLEHPSFAKNFPEVAAKWQLPRYLFNPARAAQLLEEAGWKCPAGTSGRNCSNRPREKDGQKLQYEYAATTRDDRQQIQALVSADLKAIGVDAQMKDYPVTLFFESSNMGPRASGTTKLAQFAWDSSSDSGFAQWRCSEVYDRARERGANQQRYCNPKVDELDDNFTVTVDPKASAEIYAQAQVTLMQDIVVIPLVQRPYIELVTDRLTNYKLPNDRIGSFWNARQWYFR